MRPQMRTAVPFFAGPPSAPDEDFEAWMTEHVKTCRKCQAAMNDPNKSICWRAFRRLTRPSRFLDQGGNLLRPL